MLNDRLNRTPLTRSTSLAVLLLILALALPIAGLVASAQATTAAFSGTLLDAVGRILPGSTLRLVEVRTKAKHEAVSDHTGFFAFSGLPAGDYDLEAGLPGFARAQGRLTLDAGQNLRRDVALQIGAIEETVLVSSRDAEVAPRRPSPSSRPPGADRCSQSAVGGCINPPVRIADARPRYPQEHRDAGTEGTVEVDGRIGTDGFIKDIRVTAPADPSFVRAAVEALRQWQFTSTRLGGVPVETNIHVHVKFTAGQ